jgi:hypothetical protein
MKVRPREDESQYEDGYKGKDRHKSPIPLPALPVQWEYERSDDEQPAVPVGFTQSWIEVTNPLPAAGGAEMEHLESAKTLGSSSVQKIPNARLEHPAAVGQGGTEIDILDKSRLAGGFDKSFGIPGTSGVPNPGGSRFPRPDGCSRGGEPGISFPIPPQFGGGVPGGLPIPNPGDCDPGGSGIPRVPDIDPSEIPDRVATTFDGRGAVIEGFSGYEGCVRTGDRLVPTGHSFGTSRGTRRLLLTQRGVEVSELSVNSWSDTRISATVPEGTPGDGRSYSVAIHNARGDRLSNTRDVQFCITHHSIHGSISGDYCPVVGHAQVRVEGGGVHLNVEAVRDGESGVVYRAENLPSGRYVVTPLLVGTTCPGGSWSPASAEVTLAHPERSVTRDFTHDVPLSEDRLAVSLLVPLMQSLFSGTTAVLNNYGPRSGDSWHLANGSSVGLGPALGGASFTFDIPEQRVSQFRYYVKDMNLQNVVVSRDGNAFKVSLRFENRGIELKGHCWGTDDAIDLECPAGNDSTAPDAHINDLRVDVSLTPAFFSGGRGESADLSFGSVAVDASMGMDIRGICDVLDCAPVERYVTGIVADLIEEKLSAMIDRQSVRSLVASGLAPSLDSLGIGKIASFAFEGDDLVIRHIPRS